MYSEFGSLLIISSLTRVTSTEIMTIRINFMWAQLCLIWEGKQKILISYKILCHCSDFCANFPADLTQVYQNDYAANSAKQDKNYAIYQLKTYALTSMKCFEKPYRYLKFDSKLKIWIFMPAKIFIWQILMLKIISVNNYENVYIRIGYVDIIGFLW